MPFDDNALPPLFDNVPTPCRSTTHHAALRAVLHDELRDGRGLMNLLSGLGQDMEGSKIFKGDAGVGDFRADSKRKGKGRVETQCPRIRHNEEEPRSRSEQQVEQDQYTVAHKHHPRRPSDRVYRWFQNNVVYIRRMTDTEVDKMFKALEDWVGPEVLDEHSCRAYDHARLQTSRKLIKEADLIAHQSRAMDSIYGCIPHVMESESGLITKEALSTSLLRPSDNITEHGQTSPPPIFGEPSRSTSHPTVGNDSLHDGRTRRGSLTFLSEDTTLHHLSVDAALASAGQKSRWEAKLPTSAELFFQPSAVAEWLKAHGDVARLQEWIDGAGEEGWDLVAVVREWDEDLGRWGFRDSGEAETLRLGNEFIWPLMQAMGYLIPASKLDATDEVISDSRSSASSDIATSSNRPAPTCLLTNDKHAVLARNHGGVEGGVFSVSSVFHTLYKRGQDYTNAKNVPRYNAGIPLLMLAVLALQISEFRQHDIQLPGGGDQARRGKLPYNGLADIVQTAKSIRKRSAADDTGSNPDLRSINDDSDFEDSFDFDHSNKRLWRAGGAGSGQDDDIGLLLGDDGDDDLDVIGRDAD